MPDEVDASIETEAPVVFEAGAEGAPEPSAEHAQAQEPARPLKLIRYYEDEPEPVAAAVASQPEAPASRAPKDPPRPASRGSWVSAASLAVAVFAITGVGTVMVLTHGQSLIPSGGASTTATESDHSTGTHEGTTGSDQESTEVRSPGPAGSTSEVGTDETVIPGASLDTPAPAESSATTVRDNPGADESNDATQSQTPTKNRKQRMTLEVATFIDAERARLECTRLTAETGLRAWVVTASEYGGLSYRVRLGTFNNSERAEETANNLLERGLISESRIVELPKRGRRGRH